mmetsp:Transcript_2227/g.4382  ORF Transcript_2227/g.4382 Transcript_2227/m.4382 type:complete len:255 (-) Transcript_2227:37-801(-)
MIPRLARLERAEGGLSSSDVSCASESSIDATVCKDEKDSSDHSESFRCSSACGTSSSSSSATTDHPRGLGWLAWEGVCEAELPSCESSAGTGKELELAARVMGTSAAAAAAAVDSARSARLTWCLSAPWSSSSRIEYCMELEHCGFLAKRTALSSGRSAQCGLLCISERPTANPRKQEHATGGGSGQLFRRLQCPGGLGRHISSAPTTRGLAMIISWHERPPLAPTAGRQCGALHLTVATGVRDPRWASGLPCS